MAHLDFKRYAWLISFLNNTGGSTFEDIDDAWQDEPVLNPSRESLPLRTFYNHIDAIKSIFELSIKRGKDKKYRIEVGDDVYLGRMQQNLVSMLSLSNTYDKYKDLSSRILFEDEPYVYPEWMRRVVHAMKTGTKIKISYQEYGEESPIERTVAPYCLRMFKHCWYLLAKEKNALNTFALDNRMKHVSPTKVNFTYPDDFKPEEFYIDVYGVTTGSAQKVLVKTFGRETDYWRSSPLHPSQKEEIIAKTYSIFSLFVIPDAIEIIQELQSRGSSIEVLQPKSLRQSLAIEIEKTRSRYAEFWQTKESIPSSYSDISRRNRVNMTIPTWNTLAEMEKAEKGSFAAKAVRIDVYKNNNAIFAANQYRTEIGNIVDIPGAMDPMLQGTEVFTEPFRLSKYHIISAGGQETDVLNDDCIRVARKMQKEGMNPAILNLADADIACGLYPGGSKAQEESVCRVSTLSRSLYQYYDEEHAKLVNVPFVRKAYPLDINYGGIYSPDVTVFRDSANGFTLLDNPYKVSIISVPALNFREKNGRDLEYMSPDGGFTQEGHKIMLNKIRTIFRIAVFKGHDSLVLGAFGCGAFRLKPYLVSQLFYDVMDEDEFYGRFKSVKFAILEFGPKEGIGINGRFAPFYSRFKSL